MFWHLDLGKLLFSNLHLLLLHECLLLLQEFLKLLLTELIQILFIEHGHSFRVVDFVFVLIFRLELFFVALAPLLGLCSSWSGLLTTTISLLLLLNEFTVVVRRLCFRCTWSHWCDRLFKFLLFCKLIHLMLLHQDSL